MAGLTVQDVRRFSEADALNYFRRAKWPETGGGAVCPCGSENTHWYGPRRRYRCNRCYGFFREFGGTPFQCSKLPHNDLLSIIAEFAAARKGIAARQLSRAYGIGFRTAFVTLHKLREVMVNEQKHITLSGVVEIDGATFGGYRRVENHKTNTFHTRKAIAHYQERRVLVVARQRGGRTLTFVDKHETNCVENIRRQLATGTIIQADGARCWNSMAEAFEMLRITHEFSYAANDVYTNNAESFFSMMRRQQMGTHHHLSGDLLHAYAAEMAWRQDHRKCTMEELIEILTGMVMRAKISTAWSGYSDKVRTRPVKPKCGTPEAEAQQQLQIGNAA